MQTCKLQSPSSLAKFGGYPVNRLRTLGNRLSGMNYWTCKRLFLFWEFESRCKSSFSSSMTSEINAWVPNAATVSNRPLWKIRCKKRKVAHHYSGIHPQLLFSSSCSPPRNERRKSKWLLDGRHQAEEKKLRDLWNFEPSQLSRGLFIFATNIHCFWSPMFFKVYVKIHNCYFHLLDLMDLERCS